MARIDRPRSRSGPRWLRLVVAAMMAMPIAAGAVAPVAADCSAIGGPWPDAPTDVQGLTFIGTVLGVEPFDDGASVRFAVEELLDDTADPEVLVRAPCVGTTFRTGERYLLSMQGWASGIGRSEDHAVFVAGESVAWHLPGEGKAVLLGYGPDSLRVAPPWLRHAVSRDQAVHAVLPDPSSPVPAVVSTVEDGTFRLTIASDRASYTTEEAVPVAATLELLRDAQTTIAGSGSGPVVFGVEQLDGPVDAGPAWTDDCSHAVWAPGQSEHIRFRKSGGYDPSDPMAAFWLGWYNDADLVLPAGRYRIFALTSYEIDGCSGNASELEAEVLIEVTEPTA